MEVYFELLVLLNFLVDFLLLVGTERLAGFVPRWGRIALAATLGGIYGGVCILPGFRFLGSLLWRTLFLGLMGVLAFGTGAGAVRRWVLFVLMSMALGGLAMGMGGGGFGGLSLGALGLAVLCIIGFRGKTEAASYVPVEIRRGENRLSLTALRDTGNSLRDPLTGERILVLGADAACRLTGLTGAELGSPVETLGKVPGLRLIPYRAVGKPEGLLLALRCDEVRIGGRKSNSLVAFAPEKLGNGDVYQALTGGV